MSDARVKVKMTEMVEEYEKKTTTKGADIYPVKINGTVDGKEMDDIPVTAWGEKALAALKAGQELEGTTREYKGQIEYTVFAPRSGSGGGGGYRGKSPEESASIRRQVAFKGAIDLVVAGKLDIKHLKASVDEMDLLLAAKPEEL